MTISQQINRSSKPSWQRADVGKAINRCSPHRDIRQSSEINPRRSKDSSHHDVRHASPTSHEDLFRQADLARSLLEGGKSKSKPVPTIVSNGNGESRKMAELGEKSVFGRNIAKPAIKESSDGSSHTGRFLRRPLSGSGITLTPKLVTVEERTSNIDKDNLELKSRDKGKGIDICRDSQTRKLCTLSSSVMDSNNQSKAVCPSNFVDLAKCTSSARISGRDNGNVIDLSKNTESKMMQASSLRSTGHRRLVRNGCISPLNIKRGNITLKAKHDQVTGVSSHEINIISLDSDGGSGKKLKGKERVDSTVVSVDQHVKDKSRLSRMGSLFGKEVTANADKEGGADIFEDKERRTTHAHMRKPSTSPFSIDTAKSENDDASTHPFYWCHETANGNRSSCPAVYEINDDTSLQHRSNIIPVSDSQSRNMKGKRKRSSTCPQTGDCSSSTSRNPGPVKRIRSQNDGIQLGPVTQVDNQQSPAVVYSSPSEHNTMTSDQSLDMARQVESDEILARQLQAELYNETPRTGGMEEIDAAIGWSLLQEDEVHHASSIRQDQSRHQDTSSLPAQTGVHQSFTQATNRVRRPMSNRMAQLRREFNRAATRPVTRLATRPVTRPVTWSMTSDMDLEMRLDYLEALELAFGNGSDAPSRNHLHRVQRDFNENDYEMLLALDEHNNHGGASERQINNLPQSVIQNDNPEETCAVCLEAPSIGDTIRHLPCFHKFHKECIDAWLTRKNSCPICKTGIS